MEFDLNYTLSKSIDVGSNAERINEFEGFGFGSQIINSWFPNQMRAVSDFDTRHNINANWVYALPFGRGKHFGSGMGSLANAVIGGWTVSGLWRWSSGYPFSLFSPAWATNFQLNLLRFQSALRAPRRAVSLSRRQAARTAPMSSRIQGITDNNANAAINLFRPAYPGEAGLRNGLPRTGTFDIDTGLSKAWKIKESQAVKFTWKCSM